MTNECEVRSNVTDMELFSDQYPFRLSLRISNFENESEYNKFIKSTERLIRGSIEYKQWRDYIIDVLHINTCMVTNEKMDEVSIEVHHHIPCLFVLIKSIVNEKIEKEEKFSTFDIALETIKLHFQNKVGYAILIQSMHEKLHNGFLNIPIDSVKGNYNSYLRKFTKYIDEEDLEIINNRLSINESNCSWSRNNYSGNDDLKSMISLTK